MFHALKLDKYAVRYLGAFCCQFNRRFNLEEMMGRILIGPPLPKGTNALVHQCQVETGGGTG